MKLFCVMQDDVRKTDCMCYVSHGDAETRKRGLMQTSNGDAQHSSRGFFTHPSSSDGVVAVFAVVIVVALVAVVAVVVPCLVNQKA